MRMASSLAFSLTDAALFSVLNSSVMRAWEWRFNFGANVVMSNNLATGQKDSIFSAFCSAALYKENKKMFFKKCTILLFIC